MSTCKDCIHFKICEYYDNHLTEEDIKAGQDIKDLCQHFKARSKFIELPCKVGELVYYITPDRTIRSMLVAQIFIDRAEKTIGDGGGIYFLFENFGKTVFLTKEEAEKALDEVRNEVRNNA